MIELRQNDSFFSILFVLPLDLGKWLNYLRFYSGKLIFFFCDDFFICTEYDEQCLKLKLLQVTPPDS